MSEKQKLTTNPDILITGRHIEFVTGYSVDECVNRLYQVEENDPKRNTVDIHSLDYKSAQFKVVHHNCGVFSGALHAQNDNNHTLIRVETEKHIHNTVTLKIGKIITIILIIILFPFKQTEEIGLYILLFGVFILLTLLGMYSDSKNRTLKTLQLLTDTLYIPLNNRKDGE